MAKKSKPLTNTPARPLDDTVNTSGFSDETNRRLKEDPFGLDNSIELDLLREGLDNGTYSKSGMLSVMERLRQIQEGTATGEYKLPSEEEKPTTIELHDDGTGAYGAKNAAGEAEAGHQKRAKKSKQSPGKSKGK